MVVTKSNVTIYLNSELANLAREMGLNISKTCENALKQAINRLYGINNQNNDIEQLSNLNNNVEWTGRDLNPKRATLVDNAISKSKQKSIRQKESKC